MLSTECSNSWLEQSIVDVLEVPSEKKVDSAQALGQCGTRHLRHQWVADQDARACQQRAERLPRCQVTDHRCLKVNRRHGNKPEFSLLQITFPVCEPRRGCPQGQGAISAEAGHGRVICRACHRTGSTTLVQSMQMVGIIVLDKGPDSVRQRPFSNARIQGMQPDLGLGA